MLNNDALLVDCRARVEGVALLRLGALAVSLFVVASVRVFFAVVDLRALAVLRFLLGVMALTAFLIVFSNCSLIFLAVLFCLVAALVLLAEAFFLVGVGFNKAAKMGCSFLEINFLEAVDRLVEVFFFGAINASNKGRFFAEILFLAAVGFLLTDKVVLLGMLFLAVAALVLVVLNLVFVLV